MKDLYVISGVTGMTGNELVRQLVGKENHVIGFDNFFASSLFCKGLLSLKMCQSMITYIPRFVA